MRRPHTALALALNAFRVPADTDVSDDAAGPPPVPWRCESSSRTRAGGPPARRPALRVILKKPGRLLPNEQVHGPVGPSLARCCPAPNSDLKRSPQRPALR